MIYLDHAATTPLRREALTAMMPFLTKEYGNASAIYESGSRAKEKISQCRRQMASFLNAANSEIYFTSGGSESDNWAVKMAAWKLASEGRGKHIITTSIEHHAILNSCRTLEKCGFEITYLPVDACGFVKPEDVEAAIRPDTVLISVMTANNEIGTIEPVEKIGEIAQAHGILFHTDAVQAFGHLPMDVKKMHVDLLSASAHKIGGPKGTGLLYMRRGLELPPLIDGGGQERGKRAGTENVAGIAGFAEAAGLAFRDMKRETEYTASLRNYLMKRIAEEIPGVHLNGPVPDGADGNSVLQVAKAAEEHVPLNVHPGGNEIGGNGEEGLPEKTEECLPAGCRLPNNLNVTFDGAPTEEILIMLDLEGICASGASACSAGSLEPSHVLRAIGLSDDQARSSVRFTVGADNTMQEMDETVEVLKKIIDHLRG